MADQSTFHLNGLIDIRPEANHSDARLEGRSILLSKDAKSTLIPSLEIAARDVKASHAAATGPIDPEQVFYLTSRGLSADEARALILHGFLQDVLGKLPNDPATEALTMKWETFLTKLYATPPSLV
jgi:Fe-S cluster assembly scaffold protein SufB